MKRSLVSVFVLIFSLSICTVTCILCYLGCTPLFGVFAIPCLDKTLVFTIFDASYNSGKKNTISKTHEKWKVLERNQCMMGMSGKIFYGGNIGIELTCKY